MDWQLIEPVVRAMHQRLVRDLPTVLAEKRAGLPEDEAVALADPAAVFDFPATPALLVEFPAITMLDRPSSIEDDTGSSATGRHTIAIVGWVSNPDQRLLAWTLRYYMQAIVTVAMKDRSLSEELPGAGWALGFDGVIPGDTLEDPSSPQEWVSWAAASFWIRRDEVA